MKLTSKILLFAAAMCWIGPASAADDVAVFLDRYCVSCHDNDTKKGDLTIENIKSFKDAKPEVWASIREKLQLREMPPKRKTQPTTDEREKIAAFIADSLRAAGHFVNNKLELPNYGNRIPHADLFGAKPHPAPATPVRLWRQRPTIYAQGKPGAIQAFAMAPGQQISDFSALYTVDEGAAEIVLNNAQQLVERFTQVELDNGELRNKPGTPPQLLPILHPEREPALGAFDKAVAWAFGTALSRMPTEEELTRARELYDKVKSGHGRLQAGRAVLTIPFLKPEAVYRLELGAGPLDSHGRRRLSKGEILVALHQTFFDGAAPQTIADARAKDALATREEVAALVKKLLDTPKPNARLLNFFDEYFDYRKATGVFKETPADVHFNAHQLVHDTQRLIELIVTEDKDVLRRLLTTDRTYIASQVVNGVPSRNHRIYNLPDDLKWRPGLIPLAAEERAGILTHPAWLVAHSGNFDTDPVRRGKWILEHLLGGTVPDLPVTVCAFVPPDETKTLRERFEVIRNKAYCWNCHQQMNPIGMSFEAYDHFGRYRLKELDRPVDMTGAVVDIGDPSVDGPVSSPVELIHRLAKSKRAQEVFVRYAFRFFLGRNETVRDAKTLQEASQAYTASGGSMKALVVSLLSSDSFLYRSVEP